MKHPAYEDYCYYQPTLKERLNPIWWFGNVKWPEPPDWYIEKCGGSMKKAAFWWRVRNPLTNFTRYVIGVSHLVKRPGFRVVGIDPTIQFTSDHHFNVWVLRYKWVCLPGISLWFRIGKKKENIQEQKNFHFQIGWKMSGGFSGALRTHTGL